MLKVELGLKEIIENPESIFYLLSREEKEDLRHHISFAHFKKNEFVFNEGDKPTGLQILVEGKVKIFKEGFGSRELIVRMVKPLSLMGYRAMFVFENHKTSALTLEQSIVITASPDFIFNHALKNSDFSSKLIRELCLELGFANSRMVSLTQKHIRGRLAEALLLLMDQYGFEHDRATLKVYLSRDDIANLSSMTTSNAIRTLSNFAMEKVIAIDGRKIKILDLYRLDRISKLG